MKRLLLSLLASAICCIVFAADLNPFAYNLYTSTNTDGGTRLNFSLNAPAPTVEVYIVVGGIDKKIRTISPAGKGNHPIDLTASDAASAGLTAGSSYSWKVKVTTPDRSSSAEYVGRKISNLPIFSMDIDNNPKSPYFGRILVSHGTDNVASSHGIYAYKADFSADGGRNLGSGISTYASWYSGNHLTPYRIRIAQDGSGRIFLGNYDVSHTGAYLWQVDPANLKSWTQLISRSYMKTGVGKNTDGNANNTDVYNFGLDVRTNGNQYELLLLSGNVGGSSLITGQVFSNVYTIPNITSPTSNVTCKQLVWDKKTGENNIRNLFGSALNSTAIFDKYGGAWYCGNSSSGTQGSYPGLAHQIATQTDFKIDYDNSDAYFTKKYTASGGIRYDRQYKRIAIAQGDALSNIAASIYTVTQANASTHPTLSSRVDLNAGTAKGSTEWFVTDIAWDYADNVYLCVRNVGEGIRGVYAFATDLNAAVMNVAARSNFTLALPAGGVVGTTGLNPYAYDVSATYDEATYKLTVKFSLNADAYNDGSDGQPDGVQIYLTDDPATPKKYYVYGVPANMCFKGKNKTCTIDLAEGKDLNGTYLPRNKDIYVSVTVQGDRTNASPRQISTSYKIYCCHGVAIDKNPNSKNFGKIYITESYQGTTERAAYPQTKSLPGLYVLDPNFEFTNTTRYTGGYSFATKAIDKGGYEPWRIRVSQEGRIFACSNDADNSVAVWEIDKNNYNTWTPILSGTRNAQHTFTYNGYAIGPIIGMDVKGVGNNLTLLLYTTDKDGTNYNDNHYFAYEYNVSTKAISPVSAFNGVKNFAIVHDVVSMVYGVDGSYWFGANRSDQGNGKAIQRNIAHVKLDKTTIDYENYNAEFKGGGGLINYKSTYNNATINGTNHSWLIKGKDNGDSAHGYFDVLLVTTASDGTVSVSRMDGNSGRPNWQRIEVANMDTWLNDFAIDYAENLYVVGSLGELLSAFAMPYCGEKTTTVRDEYKFQLKGQPIIWHAYHCPETMVNEDLWELFMDDYNEWYYTNKKILPKARAYQPITNAIGFTYPPEEIRETYPNGVVEDFLKNHSQWRWLYDYINTVTSGVSNEAIWSEFKTAAGITSLGTLKEIKEETDGGFTKICGALTIAKLQTVMENANWTWLRDYIKKTQDDQKSISVLCDDGTSRTPSVLSNGYTPTGDTNGAGWRYATAAFFLQSQHKIKWPASADFSTAGLPTAWGPKAQAAGKTFTFTLTGELTWRLYIHAFFNKTSSVTYKTNNGTDKTDETADFTDAGDPHAWYNTWASATLPKVMKTGDQMPKVKRKGYIFAGWHYGTEAGFTRDQQVADAGFVENATNPRHIWARWMELCLYEGYTKPDEHFLGEPTQVNYNEELMNRAAGTSYFVDVYRNITPEMYNTMTLPFAIPAPRADYLKQVTDENGVHVFDPTQGGTEPSILVFDGVQEVDQNGEKVIEFRFHELQDDEQILANTPFLFKPAQEEQLSHRLHFWEAHFSSAQPAAVSPEQVPFLPVLGPQTITIPDGTIMLILVANNRLAKVTSSSTMQGLRGYFLMPESMSSLPARICVKESEETAVENVETEDGKQVYKVVDNLRVYIIRNDKKYDVLGNGVH